MGHRALERLERLCTLAGLVGTLAWIALVPADPARALAALAPAGLWTASTVLVPVVFVSMARRLPTAHAHALRPVQGALAATLLASLALATCAWALGLVHGRCDLASHVTADVAALAAWAGGTWARVLRAAC
jgi:hypothetical protein